MHRVKENDLNKKIAERKAMGKKGKTTREDERHTCIAGGFEMAVCRLQLLAANQVFHLLLSSTRLVSSQSQ